MHTDHSELIERLDSFAVGIENAAAYADSRGHVVPAAVQRQRAADIRAAIALIPQSPCARIELVTAVHTLASHFENSLYAFRDDEEALRKAKGDIAHAMKVAARHNYNGPGCRAAPPVPAEGER